MKKIYFYHYNLFVTYTSLYYASYTVIYTFDYHLATITN